jgi:hypothetical protein
MLHIYLLSKLLVVVIAVESLQVRNVGLTILSGDWFFQMTVDTNE